MPNLHRFKQKQVLLVEDSSADVRLVQEAFSGSQSRLRIHAVPTGDAALRFLYRETPYEQAPTPDIILLDLNLPGRDGREVLREVKSNRKLSAIPVIILTSSISQSDVDTAYELSANCYLSKPLHLDDYFGLLHLVEKFWLMSARLPVAHHDVQHAAPC